MIARHINTLLLDFDKTIGFMKTPHLEMYCEIAIGTGLEIDADYLLSRLKATPLGDAWAEWRTLWKARLISEPTRRSSTADPLGCA